MAKHKKTRHQKILADLHRQHQISAPLTTPQSNENYAPTSTYTFSAAQKEETIVQPKSSTALVSYKYVVDDLRKTFLLSATIVALQLILFFSLTHHVLNLPKF